MPDNNAVDSSYANFDITIHSPDHIPNGGNNTATIYPVTARYQEKVAEGLFNQDIHQPAWQSAMPALSDPTNAPGEATITAAGSALFDALMVNDIRDLWMRAQNDLESGISNGLRIRLALQPPAVAALPWESLFDSGRNEAFAARGRTPLVRIENQHRHIGAVRALQADLPIKVLLAIPEDPSGQIDAAQEIEQITALQETLGSNFIQIIPFTGRFDIIALRRKIEQENADILHIVAHGEPTGILLWKRDKPDFAAPSSLRTVVQQAETLKLVFLNACLAGKVSDEDAFSTVGPQLLQGGVPAVIAMQFEILDQTAIEFAQFLYEELIDGPIPGAIDAAVGTARSNLYALDPESFGYGTPVLWLNAPDGQIFTVQPSTNDAAQIENRDEAFDKAEVAHRSFLTDSTELENQQLDTDLAEVRNELASIQTWTESRPEINEPSARGDRRLLLQQRTRLLDALADLFSQVQRLDENLVGGEISTDDLKQYTDKVATIRQQYESLQNIETIVQTQIGQ